MTEYTFKVNLDGITALDCFREATKDELKVLLAIKSLEDESFSAESLADTLGVSAARVKAAITIFEESSILIKTDGILAEVEYEFEPKANKVVDEKKAIARSPFFVMHARDLRRSGRKVVQGSRNKRRE